MIAPGTAVLPVQPVQRTPIESIKIGDGPDDVALRVTYYGAIAPLEIWNSKLLRYADDA